MPDPQRLRRLAPHLFNAGGDPDMAGDAVYHLIEDQIDELIAIAPNLAGVEMWVMECADIVISDLGRQRISLADICARLVRTAHDKCRRNGLALSVCLHTAAGNRSMLEGLLSATREHPDIIDSADNVIGDFHLHLPFNSHLWRAAQTNPVQVTFDLNGEYWGRNFYPTCALCQYEEHIEEARSLGAVCVNGRISTGHDRWSPHFNVLPSRRKFYAGTPTQNRGDPLASDLEVCCFDTLGGFNAEFFCRRVITPATDSRNVVRAFLMAEFGQAPEDLVAVLMDVEGVAARVFYAGHNYFNAQSVFPSPSLARFWALDLQLTTPAGEPFAPSDSDKKGRAAFSGWPVTAGMRTIGASALVSEKREAYSDAGALLARTDAATAQFAPEDRDFILRQFTDFVLLSRAATVLVEAMAHWFHWHAGKRSGEFPEPARLAELLHDLQSIARAWRSRQPSDEWKVAARLAEWHELILNR